MLGIIISPRSVLMYVFVREPLWRLIAKKGGEVWNAGGVPKKDKKNIKGLTSAEDVSI